LCTKLPVLWASSICRIWEGRREGREDKGRGSEEGGGREGGGEMEEKGRGKGWEERGG